MSYTSSVNWQDRAERLSAKVEGLREDVAMKEKIIADKQAAIRELEETVRDRDDEIAGLKRKVFMAENRLGMNLKEDEVLGERT